MVRLLRNKIIAGLCYTIAVLLLLWALAALYVDAGPLDALILLLLALTAAIFVRPAPRLAGVTLLAGIAVLVWWLSIPPSNDRDWLVDVSQLPSVTFDGSRATVSNLRNFTYRSETDFDEIWETREYDLDQLVGIDMFFVTWGLEGIAHTITSWRFADGSHLAISIETRKEEGEAYSAFKGFFRQFEIYYVVADERDVIKIRTDHRDEKVRLYQLNVPPELARALLMDYFREINKLSENARWYNALTHNCTTAIRYHQKQIGAAKSFNWRMLLNDHLDELGYERGALNQSLPIEELRRRSDVTERAKSLPADENFARAIRQGLPGFSK